MTLAERFVEHVELLDGKFRLQDPESFVREAFAPFTVTPLEGLRELNEGEVRVTGDIAVRQGHMAVYVGRGRWYESGIRIHRTNTHDLDRRNARYYRPKVVLEVPPLDGDYFYWGLVWGTGQDINRLKQWAKLYGLKVSTKRTSRKWETFGHEAVQKLPE